MLLLAAYIHVIILYIYMYHGLCDRYIPGKFIIVLHPLLVMFYAICVRIGKQ